MWTLPLYQHVNKKSAAAAAADDDDDDEPVKLSKGHILGYIELHDLTLKTPRKPASENVVCLCLANFSNLFLHTGKQCGPRSDCS